MTTATEAYTVVKTHGRVVVTPTADGWHLDGTGNGDERAGAFTADLRRCECEKPACKMFHNGHADTDSWAHQTRACHDWHLERVRALAEKLAKTYTGAY